MEIKLSLKHPKGGYHINLNRLIDVSKIFIKRDTENWDRDFCAYVYKDECGIIRYYGMGRWWFNDTYSKWIHKSRPFDHRNDLLSTVINPKWTCEIVAMGLTSLEAHILESLFLMNKESMFTKRGAKTWDGVSLINKKREKKWEKQITEFINGNYIRSTITGQAYYN